MTTAEPMPIIHIFKEYNIGKFLTTKHYKIETVTNGTNQFSDIINISKDRKCAKSSPTYWIQIHDGKKWIKPRLTGLFKTCYPSIYKGDKDHKKHLIIFKFSRDASTLTVDYYKDYYTNDLSNVLPTINLVA